MALGYLLGGGITREPQGVELYRAFPVMRDRYEQIADWCALPVSMLLDDEVPHELEVQQSIGAIRQAAIAIAMTDILAENEVHPSVVGGLSLGGLAGATLAGAVPRRQLFGLLAAGADFPGWPSSEPAQGMAVVTVPPGERIDTYLAGHPDVHQAVWVGDAADGVGTFVIVGGTADAMTRLAHAGPAGVITVLPESKLAIHTPLRAPFQAFIAPYLAKLEFTDPALPLYAGLERQPLTTAAQVRDMFDRNPVEPVYLSNILGGMLDTGVELAVIVSASIPAGLLKLPFPVVHVERPADIEKVLSAIYELDVQFPERGVAA